MKQPHNSNGANRPDPQPKPPPLDTAAEEQIEKIFDSVLADNRQRLRDMEDLSIHHIRTMGEECRGLIKTAFEQAAVASFRAGCCGWRSEPCPPSSASGSAPGCGSPARGDQAVLMR